MAGYLRASNFPARADASPSSTLARACIAGAVGLPRAVEGANSTSGLWRIRFSFHAISLHHDVDRGADGGPVTLVRGQQDGPLSVQGIQDSCRVVYRAAPSALYGFVLVPISVRRKSCQRILP